MGGRGKGQGGIAPEAKDQVADFQTEKEKAALQAGKMLLKFKSNELAPAGEARREYIESAEKVKQGVREALLREDVPPGYHESIQKYFDEILEPGAEK